MVEVTKARVASHFCFLLAFSCIDYFFGLRVDDNRPVISLIFDKRYVPKILAVFFGLCDKFDITFSVKRIVGKRCIYFFFIMVICYLKSVFSVAFCGAYIG